MATCTNGNIVKTPKPCPTVSQPICANGNNAVKIYDNDGCCFRYECECKFEIEPLNTVCHIHFHVQRGILSVCCNVLVFQFVLSTGFTISTGFTR